MNWASPRVSNPRTGIRVDWGLGETMANGSPTSAFSNVDLPTLGRPASTTVPQRVIRPNYIAGRPAGASRRSHPEEIAQLDEEAVVVAGEAAEAKLATIGHVAAVSNEHVGPRR